MEEARRARAGREFGVVAEVVAELGVMALQDEVLAHGMEVVLRSGYRQEEVDGVIEEDITAPTIIERIE